MTTTRPPVVAPRKAAPPKPPKQYKLIELGGANPVQGVGLTFDLHHWYFRALGLAWSIAISRVPVSPGLARKRDVGFQGDAVDVSIGKASGWGLAGLWPENPVHRRRLQINGSRSPASYMAPSEARRLLDRVMRLHEARELPRVGPWASEAPVTFHRITHKLTEHAYEVRRGKKLLGQVLHVWGAWYTESLAASYTSKMLAAEALEEE